MKQENFFILLELPFNPLIQDEAQIKAAIHSKQQEWSRLHSTPDAQSTALKYLELVPEIERVMLDPALRAEEAAKAQDIHDDMLSSFEAELRVLEGKGYILPPEIRALHEKYRPYGFDLKIIQKLVKAPITETPLKTGENVDAIKAIAPSKAQIIEEHLAIVDKKDLYDFLGRNPQASFKDLLDSARTIYHKAFHSEEKSVEITATQLLGEISIKQFDNEEAKASYDLFLKVNNYQRLNKLIYDEYERTGFITPEVLMRLVNFGVTTYGENVLDVEDHIREYCDAYGIVVNVLSPQIVCPNCNHTSPRGSKYCPECAAPLEGNCPECNIFFSDGISICPQCSFPIGDMGKAIPYVEQVKQGIIEKNWGLAKQGIDYINLYWPTHPELEGLTEQVSSLAEKYNKTVANVEKAVEENRYYTAQQLIKRANDDNMSLPPDLTNDVKQSIRDFERQLIMLKNRGTLSYDSLNSLANFVSDSLELSRMLSQYPPKPPTFFTAIPEGADVNLTWDKSPSPGVIEYVVVRKENSVPLTAYDGAVIYEGVENSFKDEEVPILKNYFYSIFAKRGTSFSEMGAVSSLPICIVPELKNFLITPANQAAHITWIPPEHLKEIKLWRKKGDTKPVGPEDGELIKVDRLDGYADLNLENNQQYWYYAVGVYITPDGRQVESVGVEDSVTPHEFISPIDSFTITPTDEANNYVVNWEGPPGEEVIFFSSEIKPSYPLGKMVPIDSLLYNFHRLQLTNIGDNSAKFHLRISGGNYIFPVVVAGKFGAMGRTEYLTNIPNVENITYDLVENDLYINFKWPPGQLLSVTVAWRTDSFPKDLKQKGTRSIVCSRDQYNYDAGVRIPDFSQGIYYFRIYTSFLSVEDTLIYSEGVNLLVDNTPAKEFFYNLKYSRTWFATNHRVMLTIESNETFQLPRAIIIGKVGGVPIDITDGEPLFEVEREQDIAGSISYEYKSEKLPKDMYTRLFFFDDTAYTKLRPLPKDSLKLT